MITQERLIELLRYEPDTGRFFWIGRTSNRIKIGDAAGSPESHGYLTVMIDGRNYRLHRLAWLYVYGSWPKTDIDHINRKRTDNRIDNLRLASVSQNLANMKKPKHNSSGKKGASYDKVNNKWVAQIQNNNKNLKIGRFVSFDEAAIAYDEKSKEVFGEYACRG